MKSFLVEVFGGKFFLDDTFIDILSSFQKYYAFIMVCVYIPDHIHVIYACPRTFKNDVLLVRYTLNSRPTLNIFMIKS